MSFGLYLDMSLDSMEETRILKKHSKQFREFVKKYHFSQIEIETLIIVYYKVHKSNHTKNRNGITKSQFWEVLHKAFSFTDDHLMERIFTALETNTAPSMPTCMVSVETWIAAMSLFLRGTLEEKIDFCFLCYMPIGDGLIGRDTMFHLMKKTLISSGADDDAEESVKDMIEILTKKVDKDRDGKISYSDFKRTVLEEPMLLECMGQCLPTRLAVHTFNNTVFPDPGKI